jgi:thioredoxin reductase (NADPH)
MPDKIVVYGATWCPDCRRAKQYFGENRIAYDWVDITDNPEAVAFVEKVNGGNRSIPTIVFPDGSILVEPSNAALAAKVKPQADRTREFYDVVVIGGGTAGLTAALYTSREGIRSLIIEKGSLGGQVAVSQSVENFPGFPQGITGQEFADRLAEQAVRFGVHIAQGEQVTGIARAGQYITITTDGGREIVAKAALIASGSHYKRLDVPGESDLIGRNVHFCATCDGAFYRDKDVLVIGGGNTGFEEGLHLADQFARSVTILVRGRQPRASKIIQDRVARIANITVLTERIVQRFDVDADKRLDGVVIQDAAGGTEMLRPDGVFVLIGLSPNTAFLPPEIARDEWGFIVTDATFQTSVPGIFAAGDVRQGSTKQAVAAAGEGATAALMIGKYLQSLGDLNPVREIEREAP